MPHLTLSWLHIKQILRLVNSSMNHRIYLSKKKKVRVKEPDCNPFSRVRPIWNFKEKMLATPYFRIITVQTSWSPSGKIDFAFWPFSVNAVNLSRLISLTKKSLLIAQRSAAHESLKRISNPHGNTIATRFHIDVRKSLSSTRVFFIVRRPTTVTQIIMEETRMEF